MHIETLKRKTGTKYRAYTYVNGQRMRSEAFTRMADAKLWVERVQSTGRIDRIPNFEQASESWIQAHCLLRNAPGTIAKNQTLLRELIPVFGRKPLNQIRTQDIEKHLQHLSQQGLAKSSLRHRIALIKSVYNWHIKRGSQVLNPTLAIAPLKGEENVMSYWSVEQAEQFLAYTEQKYTQDQAREEQGEPQNPGHPQKQNQAKTPTPWVHLLYLVALNTGMRWGEVLGLDWSHVDLRKETICVRQVFDEKDGKLRSFTKSRKIRYVGINETLAPALSEAKQAKTSGLLFQNLASKPIDRRSFRARHFKPDMLEAKVPRIRFHDMRHTYASLFMSNGGNLFDLQKLLGHATIAMTDRYAHFSRDHAVKRSNMVNLGSKFKVIEGGFNEREKTVG